MKFKKLTALFLTAGLLSGAAALTGCSSGGDGQVVIYSNADDEAMDAMKSALDSNGFQGKYLLQSFGTSELGGKLLAEGKNIEADLITMSSFYIDSAQQENEMFLDLSFETHPLKDYPSYYSPITAQEGTIIVNTKLMQEENLPTPASVKDLADPVYQNMISVTDIKSSSTAWLLIQALVGEYGDTEAKTILSGIYQNAGAHIEDSGSGPIKKVRAGEVAIGFGLRHQAVADKASGLPVDFIDPAEGNFSLTESVAVIDKGDKTNQLTMEMAECIINKGRTKLIQHYPLPIYTGETSEPGLVSSNPKVFPEPLTVDLLKQHQDLSESCK